MLEQAQEHSRLVFDFLNLVILLLLSVLEISLKPGQFVLNAFSSVFQSSNIFFKTLDLSLVIFSIVTHLLSSLSNILVKLSNNLFILLVGALDLSSSLVDSLRDVFYFSLPVIDLFLELLIVEIQSLDLVLQLKEFIEFREDIMLVFLDLLLKLFLLILEVNLLVLTVQNHGITIFE